MGSKHMRVLILHNQYREPGGEDSVVRADARLLREGGHQVVLFEVRNPDGAQALASLTTAGWNRKSERDVAALVRKQRFDVAHVHNTWFQLSLSVLRPLSQARVPVVMSLHNYRSVCLAATLHRDGQTCLDCIGKLPWRGVAHRCYRKSVMQSAVLAAAESAHRKLHTFERYVDVFVTPSELARRHLVAGGLPEDRLVVTPNYVPDPGPRDEPPSASRRVVFAGRLTADKGVRLLVDAWAHADLGLHLILAGEGPLRAELERALPEDVQLAGWMPPEKLTAMVRTARALTLPTSMLETFGLAAVEGMAAGAPVLTTEGGALAEAVGRAGPPAVARGGGVAAWAAALRSLCDDSAVDRWGEEVRRRYVEAYDPALALRRLTNVYQLAQTTA